MPDAQHFKIYCGFSTDSIPHDALEALRTGVHPHDIVFSATAGWTNLKSAAASPEMSEADIIFGQPAPETLHKTKVRWVHLTSAGFARYTDSRVRDHFQAQDIRLTTSSAVYADPCAEHVLAMMLSFARQLPNSWSSQTRQQWDSATRRQQSFLLRGQHILMLGFGSIGQRLATLLQPFKVKITAIRRRAETHPFVDVQPENALDALLPEADHVVNLLPGTASTQTFMNEHRLRRLRHSAFFYNVGRGSTVDQDALTEMVKGARIAGAYLDVTDPEPLPPGHPLWGIPNIHISPHSAGGQQNEHLALIVHFLNNLRAFEQNDAMRNRIY